MIAEAVPRAIPSNWSPPGVQVKFAIATMSETAAVLRLMGLEKSTLFSTQIRTPSIPIIP